MSQRKRLLAAKPDSVVNPKPFNDRIGIFYPLANGSDLFKSTYTTVDQVISNLKILFNTSKGERPFHPTFGSSLHDMLFEQITSEEDFQDKIRSSVQDAIEEWLPYLAITKLEVTIGNNYIDGIEDNDHAVTINLQLNIVGTNIYIPIRFFINETGNLRVVQLTGSDLHG